MAIVKLNADEIKQALHELPAWQLSADQTSISRSWKLSGYGAAFAHVAQLALLAEAQDHHPDISFGYGTVQITLSTHDCGGISARDVAYAKRAEKIAV